MIKTAQALGFKTLTGLPMQVHHGANGFEMWTGRKALEHAMGAALEDAFAPKPIGVSAGFGPIDWPESQTTAPAQSAALSCE